MTGKRLYYST